MGLGAGATGVLAKTGFALGPAELSEDAADGAGGADAAEALPCDKGPGAGDTATPE